MTHLHLSAILNLRSITNQSAQQLRLWLVGFLMRKQQLLRKRDGSKDPEHRDRDKCLSLGAENVNCESRSQWELETSMEDIQESLCKSRDFTAKRSTPLGSTHQLDRGNRFETTTVICRTNSRTFTFPCNSPSGSAFGTSFRSDKGCLLSSLKTFHPEDCSQTMTQPSAIQMTWSR